MTSYDYYVSNKDINREASDCMRGSWKDGAKVTLLYTIFCLALIAIPTFLGIFVRWWLSIPLGVLSLLIIFVLNYGFTKFCHRLSIQENPKANELFAGFSKKMGDALRLGLKKFFLGLMWLSLVIIPFVVKSIGYSMATLLIIDNKAKSDTALKESQHLMKQNYLRYFKFLLSNLHWFLLILISAGVGFIWIAPLFMTKKALFYENLKTAF